MLTTTDIENNALMVVARKRILLLEKFLDEANEKRFNQVMAERKELYKWRRIGLYFALLAFAFAGVCIHQNKTILKQRAVIRALVQGAQ